MRNIKKVTFGVVLTMALFFSTGMTIFAAVSTPLKYNGVTAQAVLNVDWMGNYGTGYAKTYVNTGCVYSLGVYLTMHNSSGAMLDGDVVTGFDSVQTDILGSNNATEFRSMHNIQENRVPKVSRKLVATH